MARITAGSRNPKTRSPCTRRDGPERFKHWKDNMRFSLHAQGWPFPLSKPPKEVGVLPARAGMARLIANGHPPIPSSPCTRRDGPSNSLVVVFVKWFSLHAQGWPIARCCVTRSAMVLPARAGMARDMVRYLRQIGGSPCTRRDGPLYVNSARNLTSFSLHAQGWP